MVIFTEVDFIYGTNKSAGLDIVTPIPNNDGYYCIMFALDNYKLFNKLYKTGYLKVEIVPRSSFLMKNNIKINTLVVDTRKQNNAVYIVFKTNIELDELPSRSLQLIMYYDKPDINRDFELPHEIKLDKSDIKNGVYKVNTNVKINDIKDDEFVYISSLNKDINICGIIDSDYKLDIYLVAHVNGKYKTLRKDIDFKSVIYTRASIIEAPSKSHERTGGFGSTN